MNIFQKRIENLCDEIIGRIFALMQVNSVSEVVLTDNDNPVYVIWFDKSKHSKKCTFYTLRFGCSFAAVNTIKPQLL